MFSAKEFGVIVLTAGLMHMFKIRVFSIELPYILLQEYYIKNWHHKNSVSNFTGVVFSTWKLRFHQFSSAILETFNQQPLRCIGFRDLET